MGRPGKILQRINKAPLAIGLGCGYKYADNMGLYPSLADSVVATDLTTFTLTVGPWSYRTLSLT